MGNPVGFHIWNRLVQPSPLPETFHHRSPKKPCSGTISPDFLCAPLNPRATANLLSGTMHLPILDISYKWNHMIWSLLWPTVQFSSVAQSCPTLCNPMNCSTPRLPVHHQLPEFTQIHVHRVSDAIQPSHPLSSPSPPAPNPSQHQGLFQWVNSLHEVAKVLECQLQHQSFQWTPRTDLL